MGRAKDPFLEEGSSSDSSDEDEIQFPTPNEQAEAEQFAGGHRRKRRRMGKEAAAMGIFGSDSEDEGRKGGGGGRRGGGGRLRGKNVGFLKSGEAVEDEDEDLGTIEDFIAQRGGLGTDAAKTEEMEVEEEEEEEGYGYEPEEEEYNYEEEEEEEQRPRLGLGLGGAFSRFTPRSVGKATGSSSTNNPQNTAPNAPTDLGFSPASNEGDVEEDYQEKPRLGLGMGQSFSRFAPRSLGVGTGNSSAGNSGASTPRSLNAHTGLGFKPASTPSPIASSPQPETAPSQTFASPLGRGFVSSSSSMRLPQLNPTVRNDTNDSPQISRPSVFTPTQPSMGREKAGAKASAQSGINQNSFAARMMAKMGYVAGQGLGKTGEGILNPIEVKLRPQGAGVGVIKEKTEQARAEAKRIAAMRGEVVSDSEDEKEKKAKERRKRNKESPTGTTPSGTPLRIKKKKNQFRTAEEISASAKGLEVPSVLKSIVDYTGKDPKLLTSAQGIMSSEISVDTESLKIAKMARRDLERFAGDWKGLQDQKAYIEKEEIRVNAEIDEQAGEIRRMQGMIDVVKGLQNLSLDKTDPESAIQAIVTQLEVLQFEYKNEVESHDLSEVAVGASHPLFKKALENWSPLTDPFLYFDYFRRLREIFHIRSKGDLEAEYAKNGHIERSKSTTHYESMIYSLWLPKVRSAINNDWDVHKPDPVLALLDVWGSVLPSFVQANVLDQLVLPKLRTAVADWNPRITRKKRSVPPPHLWVFQWLPYLGSNMSELLRDVRRKFGIVLDTWKISKGPIEGLEAWKEVFGPGELEAVLVRHLLPRLALSLRTDFDINPADQELDSLEAIFKWSGFFKPSTFGQLFEAEFFPKWLNTLHSWLTAEPIFTEVQEWYMFWQDVFPEDLRNSPLIKSEFKEGLDMMNAALDLGSSAATKLPPPAAGPAPPIGFQKRTAQAPPTPINKTEIAPEITFRDAVEDWCADHNLLLIPLRKAHEASGTPLFRITASASGSGGAVVYFKGDVVWAQDKKERQVFEPLGLEGVLDRVEGATR